MALSTDDVRHVAALANLRLDDEELERYRRQLSDILSYADKVGAVATGDTPPTTHPYPLANVLRDDVPQPSLPVAVALSPAPATEDNRVRVPRIVDEAAS